jgi:hypothetical protein
MNAPITSNNKKWSHLRAYYQFNENSLGLTSGIVMDSKGKNNGTNVGATWKKNSLLTVAVHDVGQVTFDYTLQQNYPNPFNPTTDISYSIPEAGLVTLRVFNILGQEVATLVNHNMQPGKYIVDFDASQLCSGVYIYQLTAGTYTSSKKMMLLK